MTLEEQLEHWRHVHEEALLYGTEEDVADAYGMVRMIEKMIDEEKEEMA